MNNNWTIEEGEHDFIFNMFYIYVLECENNKFYIGKSSNPSFRLEKHFNGEGSFWTKKYNPIKVIEIIQSTDSLDEDKITKKYMMKFGIQNVRGGSYTKFELDDWMIKSLEHEFISAKDICYTCNQKGHFSKECPLNNKFNIEKYLEEFKNLYQVEDEISKLEQMYKKICILNYQIKSTENCKDEEYIKKKLLEGEIVKIDEEILLLRQTFTSENCYRNNEKTRDTNEKINNLVIQKRKIVSEIDELNQKLGSYNYTYHNICIKDIQDTQDTLSKNDIIFNSIVDNILYIIYKIIIYNLEKKKELKEFIDITGTEDLIEKKLFGLFKKKITLMT